MYNAPSSVAALSTHAAHKNAMRALSSVAMRHTERAPLRASQILSTYLSLSLNMCIYIYISYVCPAE